MKKISFMRNFPESGRATNFIERIIAGAAYGNVIPLITLDSISLNNFRDKPKMLTIRKKESYIKDCAYTAFAWEGTPYKSHHIDFAHIRISDVMPVAVFSDEIRYCIDGRWQSREDWNLNLSLFDGFDNLSDFFDYHAGMTGYIFSWNYMTIENMLCGGIEGLKDEADAMHIIHGPDCNKSSWGGFDFVEEKHRLEAMKKAEIEAIFHEKGIQILPFQSKKELINILLRKGGRK